MQHEVAAHVARREALVAAIRSGARHGAPPLGLDKRNSNLFRDRSPADKRRLDLNDFCHVLEIDTRQGWVDVEGLATYEALVAETLSRGVMPAVVPQLKTITVGGAAAGVGIEATSHRCGLVHHTLLEIDVLLPSGEVVHCTPDNAHQDLFFGFPNSYGTLGYALRLRLRTLPVKPFVKVEHLPHNAAPEFFGALAARCNNGARFLDGVVFSAQQQVISMASFVDAAPWLSDYSLEQIYYRSLLHKTVDYLRVQDYLWRWDTDWFWCSKNLGAQHPLVRRLLGRSRLNSRTYTRVMRWNARWGLTRRLVRWRGRFTESVIQDVDIPIAAAAEFLGFLLREIGILPVWICPLRAIGPERPFTLYPIPPFSLYVNFGFWDVVESAVAHEAGHFNRMVEREVLRLGGIKSLYSDSFFTREEFDRAYGMAGYQALKDKYDPEARMLGLHEKCVLHA
jgi:FAD/FMN-containing dehydrogenase